MTFSNDDAYDRGDPKRSDYVGKVVCALCAAPPGRHYTDCPEVVMSR